MHKQKGIVALLAHYLIPQRSNNHRPKILHPESFLILAMLVTGFFSLIQTIKFFPSLQNSILGYATNISIEDVVVQTNEQRVQQGLSPLTLNSQLSAAALAKAQDMLDNQYWAHTSPQGKQPWDFMKAANYRYKVAGENLARDFYQTTDMVNTWMASPSHKDNILNGQYQQIGIAVVNGRLEGFETTLVVQMFGTPINSTPVVSETASNDTNPILADTNVVTQQANSLTVVEPNNSKQTTPIHNPMTAVAEQDDPVEIIKTDQSVITRSQQGRSSVLSAVLEPIAHLKNSPVFTPLLLTKIVFLAVIMLIILTLTYDSLVIGNRKTMRLVGQNVAHIILFSCVVFLVILFKGGMIK